MVFEPRERRVRNRRWRGGWLHGAYWLKSSQILETTSAKLARCNFSIKRTKTEQRSFRMILNLELPEGADPVACTVRNFDIDSFFVEKYIRVRFNPIYVYVRIRFKSLPVVQPQGSGGGDLGLCRRYKFRSSTFPFEHLSGRLPNPTHELSYGLLRQDMTPRLEYIKPFETANG